MRLIYLSTALSDKKYEFLVEKCGSSTPSYSGIGFDYRIWCAMKKHFPSAKAFSYVPLSKNANIDLKDFSDHEITVINYNYRSDFKEIFFMNKLRKMIQSECNKSNEDVCILISGLYRVFVSPALYTRKKSICKVIGIVPDLPRIMSSYYGQKKILQKLKMKVDSSIGQKCKNKLDGYIFLAEAMNSLINKYGAPYAVIDGLVDDFSIKINEFPKVKHTVIYAGKVAARFGVLELVEAFLKANISNINLHIYGGGDALDEISRIAGHAPNVFVHGIVSHNEVVEAESKATLLIEPRNPKQDFCNYSFPSKVLEYMATGTPVLMAPLPNMNPEYYPLFFHIDDSSVEGIACALVNTLSKDISELALMGLKAQRYIQRNKTVSVQSLLIKSLIERVMNND